MSKTSTKTGGNSSGSQTWKRSSWASAKAKGQVGKATPGIVTCWNMENPFPETSIFYARVGSNEFPFGVSASWQVPWYFWGSAKKLYEIQYSPHGLIVSFCEDVLTKQTEKTSAGAVQAIPTLLMSSWFMYLRQVTSHHVASQATDSCLLRTSFKTDRWTNLPINSW